MVEDAPFVAQPNRTFRQSKAPSPAQIRRQKQRQSEERTCGMTDAAYQRQHRHAQVAIVCQKVPADAMRDVGMEDEAGAAPGPAEATPDQGTQAIRTEAHKAWEARHSQQEPSGKKPKRRWPEHPCASTNS